MVAYGFPERVVVVEVAKPDHVVIWGGHATGREENRYVLRVERLLLCVQSLYTLNSDRWPNSPLNLTAVISVLGMFNCMYASVAMLVLIMVMERERGVSSRRWGRGI